MEERGIYRRTYGIGTSIHAVKERFRLESSRHNIVSGNQFGFLKKKLQLPNKPNNEKTFKDPVILTIQ